MFRYVGEVSILAQKIIKNYMVNFNYAVDATLGNGHDTDFLSNNFKQVYSFDIQKTAVENYISKSKENVKVILDSHEFLDKYIYLKVDCIMYNLGYLPGGDKSITTRSESTIKSLGKAVKLLNENGIVTICMYNGHNEGKKERNIILDFTKLLPKNEFGVMIHSIINRIGAPELIVIEKK
jgi:hypothetical protein